MGMTSFLGRSSTGEAFGTSISRIVSRNEYVEYKFDSSIKVPHLCVIVQLPNYLAVTPILQVLRCSMMSSASRFLSGVISLSMLLKTLYSADITGIERVSKA